MTALVRTTANALVLRSRPTIGTETDTGKRLIAGQVAAALGETFDKQWQFLVAPAGDGWASRSYLATVPLPVPAAPPPRVIPWPKVPNGRAEIVALFGEPCTPRCQAGRVTLPASLPLAWDKATRITRFACHELMVPVFTSVFAEIHRRGFWPLLEDWGGCFECREKRGTIKKTSTHSWGITSDVNPNQNPLGAKPKMPAPIIAIFADHGFEWGGTWKRKDGMHFQYATGY